MAEKLGKLGDNTLAPAISLNLLADVGADIPVHVNQFRIYRPHGTGSGIVDDLYDLIKLIVHECQILIHSCPSFSICRSVSFSRSLMGELGSKHISMNLSISG